MSAVFADAFYFVARLNGDDQHQPRCARSAKRFARPMRSLGISMAAMASLKLSVSHDRFGLSDRPHVRVAADAPVDAGRRAPRWTLALLGSGSRLGQSVWLGCGHDQSSNRRAS